MTVPPSPGMPPANGDFPPPSFGGPGLYPQQSWPPPPRRGGAWKWILGAVALLAVIGVTVAATASVINSNRDRSLSGSPTSTDQSHSDIASADDTAPVSVIIEDPSCAAQKPILDARAARQANGWVDRNPAIPRSDWTPEIRDQYEAVAGSMRTSADQLVAVAKLTPHRVMRELYEQLIAYSRAYAESIPSYVPGDDKLARVATTTADAIGNICAAINFGSAAARGPLVRATPPAVKNGYLGDVADPQRFLTEPDAICGDWSDTLSGFHRDAAEWETTDPNIPASQWTPELQRTNEKVAPVMERLASELQALAGRSSNMVMRDFANLSAQYRLAFVEALPTYTPADNFLALAALRLGGVVQAACEAVV